MICKPSRSRDDHIRPVDWHLQWNDAASLRNAHGRIEKSGYVEKRKNATPTHTILPHSFFYPVIQFPSLIIPLAPAHLENPSLASRRTCAEPPVTLASTLRS